MANKVQVAPAPVVTVTTVNEEKPVAVENLIRNKIPSDMFTDLHYYQFGERVAIDFSEVYQHRDEECQTTALGEAIEINLFNHAFKLIFNWTQAIFYYTFSIIVGFIMTIIWGILYGLNKVAIVWLVQPAWKLAAIWLRAIGYLHRVLIRTICDPCFESVSMARRNIRGIFHLETLSDIDKKTIG